MGNEEYGDRVNAIWKHVALTLGAMILPLCLWGLTISKDAISRSEVEAQMARVEERVRQLQIDVARMSERMGLPAHPGSPEH